MNTLGIRLAAVAGGLVVAAIGFLVSTRVLDVALTVPAGPGGGEVALTLPRIVGVTALFVVIGLVAAMVFERTRPNPQGTWIVFALVGLVLSVVPTALLIDDIGAKGILAIIHLVVGSVVIPTVAATLPSQRPA